MRNYIELGSKIIMDGKYKKGRNATTLSMTGQMLEFNMADGFPLLTSKYINFNHILHETLWYLQGTTSIEYLHKHNIHIWDNWAKNNDIGKTYGYQWREFNGNDELGDQWINAQILLKSNPTSRRIIINGWNPLQLHEMALPPCLINLHFLSNEGKLDLVVYQRSADFCLGVPYDIAEMALLLHIMARDTDLKPNKLTIMYGDIHIYENHISKFVNVQMQREPRELPRLVMSHKNEDITLLNYNPHDKINFKISI